MAKSCGKIPIEGTDGGILYHKNGTIIGIDSVLYGRPPNAEDRYHLNGPLEFISYNLASRRDSKYIIYKCGIYFVRFFLAEDPRIRRDYIVSSITINGLIPVDMSQPIDISNASAFENHPDFVNFYIDQFHQSEIVKRGYPPYDIYISKRFDGPADEYMMQFLREALFDLPYTI